MPEITKLKCKKCGHEWVPTKEKPSCCPRCKNYDYDKDPATPKANIIHGARKALDNIEQETPK